LTAPPGLSSLFADVDDARKFRKVALAKAPKATP
jgi:hypothetical protein